MANGYWMDGGVSGTMSITTSPKSSLAKLGLYPKPKPFKIMVLGQSGVGKSGKTNTVLIVFYFVTELILNGNTKPHKHTQHISLLLQYYCSHLQYFCSVIANCISAYCCLINFCHFIKYFPLSTGTVAKLKTLYGRWNM